MSVTAVLLCELCLPACVCHSCTSVLVVPANALPACVCHGCTSVWVVPVNDYLHVSVTAVLLCELCLPACVCHCCTSVWVVSYLHVSVMAVLLCEASGTHVTLVLVKLLSRVHPHVQLQHIAHYTPISLNPQRGFWQLSEITLRALIMTMVFTPMSSSDI